MVAGGCGNAANHPARAGSVITVSAPLSWTSLASSASSSAGSNGTAMPPALVVASTPSTAATPATCTTTRSEGHTPRSAR